MQSETLAKCHATALTCFFRRFTFRESLMTNLLICDPLSLSIITLSNMDHSLRPYWVYSLGDIDVLVDLIGLTLILIVKELLYSSAEGRPGGIELGSPQQKLEKGRFLKLVAC